MQEDPGASSRKKDHIELAFKSRLDTNELDPRFYYEPMLAALPENAAVPSTPFLGKILRLPMWVSSMTGGTELARTINHNLARACAEFGMGMGLGSCRQLLYDNTYLADFDVRDTLGPEQPLYANLGVAQIEQLMRKGEGGRLAELVHKLRADGLIVHVNPLQEAMQPEGDHYNHHPIELVQWVLESYQGPVIVKEVGQGFGPESIRALLQMPLAAIELAAAGGTNFAKLELLRTDDMNRALFEKIAHLGHTAEEMVGWLNRIQAELGEKALVKNIIISGGVRDFLDGYYLIRSAKFPAVFGQASALLKFAREDYAPLQEFLNAQRQGLALAWAFLRLREAE